MNNNRIVNENFYDEYSYFDSVLAKHFKIEEMEADHVDPWHSGGRTDVNNGQMLCKHCNRIKSGHQLNIYDRNLTLENKRAVIVFRKCIS